MSRETTGRSRLRRSRGRIALASVLVLAAEAALISGQTATAAPDEQLTPGTATATAKSSSKKEIWESDLGWAAQHAKGSKAWAITQAKKTGKRVVATDETTPTTYTVANPDGTLTTELTAGPERVWKNGAWQKADATLVRDADGGIVAKAHPNGLRLGGKSGTLPKSLRAAQDDTARDLVTLGSDDSKVTLQWKGGLPQPELDGTQARYRNAVPGADVIVEATRTGFEQFVEISERPAGAYAYTLPVKAKGLKAKANKDGSVTFTDARTGAERAIMPAPVMWDAAVDKVSGEHTHRARVDMKVVSKGAGEVDLVVTPSAKFLADPATKFPVTVDPSTSALANTFDTYVQQGETVDWSTDVELDFGNPGTKNADGTPRTARSFITWNTTPIQDALIVDTNLSLWNFHSGNTDCSAQKWTVWDTSAPSTSSRWAAQPTWNQEYHSSTETKGNPDCAATQPDGWINADVDTLVQSWASAKATRGHMGLRAATDDIKAWKRVNSANNAANQPKLSVTYNYRPSDGTNRQAGAPFKSYAGVWAVNTTTPTLRDTFTDPDGDKVNGTFQVYDAATNTPITTPAGEGLIVSDFVDSGKPASGTVPAGQLQDGKTYKFRTNAYDGTHYNLSWSPWTQFVVDTTAPGLPDVTSTTYPENLPGGATGEQGRFDVDTKTDDAREVHYRVGPADTDDDGNSGNTSPDGWQSTPANLTFSATASFSVTPTADGSHQAEVRTVDRADNVGTTRVYGFASPRRTDTGRAKVVDIDLPTPDITAVPPAFHDGPQPAWEWVTARANGTVADGKPQVYRSENGTSRSTVTITPLAKLERTPEQMEQLEGTQPRPRLAEYPDPIITGSWCDPTLVNIEAQMTRTEACLPQQVSYKVTDLSTPPKVYEQIFDVLYMVKVDPVSNKIKTWMQIFPKQLGFAPNLPFPGGVNGMITLDVQSWCQSDGCDKQQQDWDFYGGKSTWNGNQDQHIITGIADFEWNGNVNNAAGTKDKDLSKVMPLRWWMDWGTTVPGVPVEDDSKGPSLPVTARCDKVVSGKNPGCVLPAYKPGYTINSEAFPGAAAHIWLIQNKHAKKLGRSPQTPLHYLPSKARNAPGQETENKLDNGKPGNRKAICGRAFRKHPDTATIATPSGNADPISCDEYPFAATYESSGFPTANGGLNAAQNIDYAGLECVQTVVAKGDGTREHLYNDTTYDDPKWPALCGRSSMSNYVNTQSMQPFGVKFAKDFRLLDYDEYWVDPANARFSGCDPSQAVIKCKMN
ncbi:DNRLRE domain-containing protein [Streptomyces sp. NPDC057460]|uniref:DNRLRE domain-containing protein n=1 Tax=Streptomyces sp. NPDC057460 TaxID=3346141 RepID=UPI0036B564D2